MNGPKLNIGFKDSLKITIKNLWFGMLMGVGLSAYMGYLKEDIIFTVIIPVIVFVTLFVSFIAANGSHEFLTKDGITYKEPFKLPETISWNEVVDASQSSKKYPDYVVIKASDHKKPIQIHRKVFLYPHVSEWIKKYAPENHVLREFCK